MKRSEARREVSNYIHWYNSERLHLSLDHMSPIDFERQLTVESTQQH
jgi:transposase InsO family protein